MQRCEDNVAARLNGNALQPLSDVSVTVTDDHTGLPAALYSDNGVTQVFQPLKTDDNGYYGFYAANGEYTLTFSGIRIATFTRKIVLNDPDDNPVVTKADLAAGSGASLVKFTPAGAGGIPQDLQVLLRTVPHASSYATAQQAVDAGAAKKALYLDVDLVLGASDMLDFSAASGMIVFGPGRIIGPAVASQSQPTARIKMWGSLGAPVAYTSTIAEAAINFPVTQSFAAGDLLLLSNFPTDATDAYTEGGPDLFGERARTYANFSPANLRQTRRKELLSVRSSTGTVITTATGTVSAYPSTAGLQFQKVTPVRGVHFIGTTIENVHVNLRYAQGVRFTGCRAYSCMLVAQASHNLHIDFTDFDSRGTDCRLDIFEACRNIKVTGTYRNFNSPSDNGIIKFLGCADFETDVIIEGCKGSAGNGLMIDTAFTENPSGYSDLPAKNFRPKVMARYCDGQGLVITCDPYAAKAEYGQVFYTSDDTGMQIKGAENIVVYDTINFADGSNNSVYLYGARDINFNGKRAGNFFTTTISNPRNNAQTQAVANISRSGALVTLAAQPAFCSNLTAVASNVTGDGTEPVIAFNSDLYDKTNSHVNGVFTAPVDGVYSFKVVIKLNSVGSSHTGGYVKLLAGATSLYVQPSYAALADASGNCGISIAWPDVFMTAGQTAQLSIKVTGGTKTVSIQGGGTLETFWSGVLLN